MRIEEVVADGRKYAQENGLRLPPRVRDLTADFTAPNLVTPERVRVEYMLEGQDPKWRECVNRRQAQYPNLGPQDYRFRIIVSNSNGIWNETGDTLQLYMAPAY